MRYKPANRLMLDSRQSAILMLLIALLVLPLSAVAQDRGYDQSMLDIGQSLYQANCANCHGQNAEGAVENWHKRGEDGNLPAPPLNGTGHAWHHPVAGLAQTIRNGTQSIGGNMPSWKDKLSDDEVFAIIIWFSSLWPDEVYQAWLERNNQ